MALATMQKKHLGRPDEVARFDRITKENVILDDLEVHRVTFAPGARWSVDLKPHAGTDSCELPHVAYVASGRLHVVMDDNSEEEFGPHEADDNGGPRAGRTRRQTPGDMVRRPASRAAAAWRSS